MAWTQRTTYSGMEYGGTASQYYWSTTYNHYAYASICLANCTCYAEGRQAEGGITSAVDFTWAVSDLGGLPSAWQFHWYPNTSDNWASMSFAGNQTLIQAGDLLVWSDNTNGNTRNHVAVVESVVTSGYVWTISESLYTSASIRSTGTLAQISAYMISNYPSRFFNYRTLYRNPSSVSWYGEDWPDYIIHNTGSASTNFNFFGCLNKKRGKIRRTIHV